MLKYDLTTNLQLQHPPFENPVLIFAGRQDHIVGYRNQWEFALDYPRASFVMLDRAGHNLQIEQTQVFNTLVNEWLDRVVENNI